VRNRKKKKTSRVEDGAVGSTGKKGIGGKSFTRRKREALFLYIRWGSYFGGGGDERSPYDERSAIACGTAWGETCSGCGTEARKELKSIYEK